MNTCKELMVEMNKLIVAIEMQRILAENDYFSENILNHKRKELEAIRDKLATEDCGNDIIDAARYEIKEAGGILKEIMDVICLISFNIDKAQKRNDFKAEETLIMYQKRLGNIRNKLIEEEYSIDAKKEASNELQECKDFLEKIEKKNLNICILIF